MMIVLAGVLLLLGGANCQESIIPIHYEITTTPNLQTLTFTGVADITLNVEEATQSILLYGKSLSVSSVTLLDQEAVEVEQVTFEINADSETINIKTEAELSAGRLYHLNLVYSGLINEDQEGLYVSRYTNAGTERLFALTNLRFSKARQVFPSLDDPKYPATFVLHIVRPNDYISISNMVKTSETEIDDTNTKDTFATSDLFATDLVAFAIIDFTANGNEDYPIYSINNENINLLEEWSQKIADKFKTSYPIKLNRIQQIIVPDGALPEDVLANIGLIFYRQSAVLYNSSADSSRQKQTVIQNIAHAITRQDYTQVGTFNWLSNYWLAEGIYGVYKHEILESLEPEWQITNQFVVERLSDVMEVDKDESELSLAQNTGLTRNLGRLFADKAFAIVRMFINQDSLGDIFEYAASSAALSWVQNKGYPIVSVQRDFATNVLNFSQNSLPFRTIPISIQEESFTELDATKYKLVLSEGVQEVTLNAVASSWYIININRYGYFVPSYDSINWEALINFMQNGDLSKLTPVDRALLIENAFTSAESGRLHYPNYLELLRYASRETEYFPVHALIKTTSRLRSQLVDSPTQHKFLTYIRNITSHLITHVGTSILDDDAHLERLNRINTLIWLCNFEHDVCQQEMTNMYTSGATIHPDLEEAVYCGAMQTGDLARLDQIYKLYYAEGKKSVLKAMACSSDSHIVGQYLLAQVGQSSWVGIRQADKVDAFIAALDRSDIAAKIALELVKLNINYFVTQFSYDDFSIILTKLSEKLATNEQLDEIDVIFNSLSVNQQQLYQNLFTTVKSNMQKNIDWKNSYLESVESWLNEQIIDETTTSTTDIPTEEDTDSTDSTVTSPETTTVGEDTQPETTSSPSTTPGTDTDPPPGDGVADYKLTGALLVFTVYVTLKAIFV